MKKLIIAAVLVSSSLCSFSAVSDEIDENVLRVFRETFSDVKNATWHEDGDTYTVRFVRNDIDTRITYDKDANMVRTMRYYSEKNLPAFIRGKITKKFDGKSIFGVTESTTESGTEYHITLQDEKNWLVVVSDASGSMHVEKKFRKA